MLCCLLKLMLRGETTDYQDFMTSYIDNRTSYLLTPCASVKLLSIGRIEFRRGARPLEAGRYSDSAVCLVPRQAKSSPARPGGRVREAQPIWMHCHWSNIHSHLSSADGKAWQTAPPARQTAEARCANNTLLTASVSRLEKTLTTAYGSSSGRFRFPIKCDSGCRMKDMEPSKSIRLAFDVVA